MSLYSADRSSQAHKRTQRTGRQAVSATGGIGLLGQVGDSRGDAQLRDEEQRQDYSNCRGVAENVLAANKLSDTYEGA